MNPSVIHTIRRQQKILEELICHFDKREHLNEMDRMLYDAATRKIEKNLRSLRKKLTPQNVILSEAKNLKK